MLRLIKSNIHLLCYNNRCLIQRCSRTYLSESYNCVEAWSHRYETPLLREVNPRDLFFELNQKLQNTGKISAIDVDIFVNTVKDPETVEEIIDIVHQLRLSAETSNTLDSTHHALIRYLLDFKHEEILFEVLNDRLNYGIFPDNYCYNLMMNTFLTRNDFTSAARIATLLMLQENSEHLLSNALAIYSCYRYLDSPNTTWQSPTSTATDEKKDIIKVRVRYLRNPYFDDHFDLTEPKQLVGKTLVFFGKLIDDTVGRSCLLRGYILWLKYEYAAEAIKTWISQGINEIIYAEILSVIEKEISEIPEDKITDDLKDLKIQLKKLASLELKDGSVLEESEKRLREVINERETVDIMDQCQVYKEWESNRMNLLEKQMQELDKMSRLENVERIKRNLQERERLLTFFNNEEEIELRIEQKLEYEDEKYGTYIQVDTEIEDNYIPPEITKQTPKRK